MQLSGRPSFLWLELHAAKLRGGDKFGVVTLGIFGNRKTLWIVRSVFVGRCERTDSHAAQPFLPWIIAFVRLSLRSPLVASVPKTAVLAAFFHAQHSNRPPKISQFSLFNLLHMLQ